MAVEEQLPAHDFDPGLCDGEPQPLVVVMPFRLSVSLIYLSAATLLVCLG